MDTDGPDEIPNLKTVNPFFIRIGSIGPLNLKSLKELYQ